MDDFDDCDVRADPQLRALAERLDKPWAELREAYGATAFHAAAQRATQTMLARALAGTDDPELTELIRCGKRAEVIARMMSMHWDEIREELRRRPS